jgi:CO/xanthine dehydrogenase Mo-binding subunit
MTSELALKRDGTMLGLKVRVVANLGAYLRSNTAIPPQFMMAMAPGGYQIRNCRVEVVGEAGCNGAPPAVANAVMDALAPLGIDHINMPYTAPKLWEAIQAAPGKSNH